MLTPEKVQVFGRISSRNQKAKDAGHLPPNWILTPQNLFDGRKT